MEITISQLLNLEPILIKLKEQKMPFKTTYKLSKLYAAFQEESQFYYTNLNAIITQYGELNPDGSPIYSENGILIKPEYVAEAQAKLNELMGVKIIVPDIKFNSEELDLDCTFSIDELSPLIPFIEE